MIRSDKNAMGGEEWTGRPLVPGILALPSGLPETAHLIGARCKRCGKVLFPSYIVCPACGEMDIEEIALGNKGTLHTFSKIYVTPSGSLFQAPYVGAIVELPEGVQIRALLECDLEKLTDDDLGREVELMVEKVTEDEDGKPVFSFKYRFA